MSVIQRTRRALAVGREKETVCPWDESECGLRPDPPDGGEPESKAHKEGQRRQPQLYRTRLKSTAHGTAHRLAGSKWQPWSLSSGSKRASPRADMAADRGADAPANKSTKILCLGNGAESKDGWARAACRVGCKDLPRGREKLKKAGGTAGGLRRADCKVGPKEVLAEEGCWSEDRTGWWGKHPGGLVRTVQARQRQAEEPQAEYPLKRKGSTQTQSGQTQLLGLVNASWTDAPTPCASAHTACHWQAGPDRGATAGSWGRCICPGLLSYKPRCR